MISDNRAESPVSKYEHFEIEEKIRVVVAKKKPLQGALSVIAEEAFVMWLQKREVKL